VVREIGKQLGISQKKTTPHIYGSGPYSNRNRQRGCGNVQRRNNYFTSKINLYCSRRSVNHTGLRLNNFDTISEFIENTNNVIVMIRSRRSNPIITFNNLHINGTTIEANISMHGFIVNRIRTDNDETTTGITTERTRHISINQTGIIEGEWFFVRDFVSLTYTTIKLNLNRFAKLKSLTDRPRLEGRPTNGRLITIDNSGGPISRSSLTLKGISSSLTIIGTRDNTVITGRPGIEPHLGGDLTTVNYTNFEGAVLNPETRVRVRGRGDGGTKGVICGGEGICNGVNEDR